MLRKVIIALCALLAADPAIAASPALRQQMMQPPGWVLPGLGMGGYDYDFKNGRYYVRGTGLIPPLVTVSRTSAGYAVDSLGNWWPSISSASCPANQNGLCAARATNLGIKVEEARTNSIRNNTTQGAAAGTPGTLPTNWQVVNAAGLTTNVIATGTQNGISYIDVQITGTSSGTTYQLAYESGTQIAASYGQTWTQASFVALVGGTLTNVTTIRVQENENTSGGSFVSSHFGSDFSGTIPSSLNSSSRQQVSATLTGTTTGAILPIITVLVNNSSAVNVTFRIGWPQLELNPNVNSTVAAAAVATGGTVCVPGTDTFTIVGGVGTAATVSGTVTGGILGGALTVVTPGSYTTFPPSPATTTGGTCTTQPTINLTPTNNAALGWATTPIPTTNAAVTRNADAVTLTNAPKFCGAYTEFAAGTPDAPTGYATNQNIIAANDGTANNRMGLFRTSSTGLLNGLVEGGGSAFYNQSVSTWSQSTSGKSAVSYATGAQNAAFNTTLASSGSSVTVPAAFTVTSIGNRLDGTGLWNGTISRIAVAPCINPPPPAQLQAITNLNSFN